MLLRSAAPRMRHAARSHVLGSTNDWFLPAAPVGALCKILPVEFECLGEINWGVWPAYHINVST